VKVVVVPGVLALLPQYTSLDDPVADLRAACHEAVAWLCETDDQVAVYCEPRQLRLAKELVLGAGGRLHPVEEPESVLVIANGSAKRTHKAPGYFDERAEAFDAALGRALRGGDSRALAEIDEAVADELWADVRAFRSLGSDVDLAGAAVWVDYDDAPYGVQYWVVRLQCPA
jgi:hypothetical protein